MKTLLTGALVLLLALPSFAATDNTAAGGYRPFTIPANATARQITKLFIQTTEGIHDPFMVLSANDKLKHKRVIFLNAM